MKRTIVVSLLFLLIASASMAQRGGFNRQVRPVRDITAYDRLQLRRDALRFRIAGKLAESDGIVSPMERRRLHKIRRRTRRDTFRYRMSKRRRIIL